MIPDGSPRDPGSRTDRAAGPSRTSARLRAIDVGLMPYAEALAIQRRLADAKKSGMLDEDLLLILEHPPVITLGRGSEDEDVIVAREVLEARGVPIVEIERGGDVTYHGPGQLVAYPILDLHHYRRDLHWYLRTLELALANALRDLGLQGFRIDGYTGVWVGEAATASPADAALSDAAPPTVPALDPSTAASQIACGGARKIASIGVHASRWVTWHGVALNVTEEPLSAFEWIVPCGIPGARMTSLHAEGVPVGRGSVVRALADGFAAAFEARLEWADKIPAAPPVASATGE